MKKEKIKEEDFKKQESLSDEELEKLRKNFYENRNLNINHMTSSKKTIFSFTEEELKAFRDNPTLLSDFSDIYKPLDTELHGDETYEHYTMPDGTINEKYQQRKALEFALNPPVDDTVPFRKIPAAIRSDGLEKIAFGWGFFFLVLITYIMAFVDYPMLLFGIFFALMLTYIGVDKILTGKFNQYVKFEGIIVDTHIYGLTKSSKYMIVKMSDGEKFLNIKTMVSKDIKPGLPITVYLPPNLLITASKYGPLAEYIIAYKLDISTDATDELLAEGNISADEYIRHDPISGEIREDKFRLESIASYDDSDDIKEQISKEKNSNNEENLDSINPE